AVFAEKQVDPEVKKFAKRKVKEYLQGWKVPLRGYPAPYLRTRLEMAKALPQRLHDLLANTPDYPHKAEIQKAIRELEEENKWQQWWRKFQRTGSKDEKLAIIKDYEKDRAVPYLAKALKDKDPSIRNTVIYALWHMDDPRTIDPLKSALKDEDRGLRRHAALALGIKGDASALRELLIAMKDEDEDWLVRLWAAELVGKLGDSRGVDMLIPVLKGEWQFPRGVAAESLGEIGDPRALGPLKAMLQIDQESDVRKKAQEAIAKLEKTQKGK
ncbi:HEAT repeat domain-containing protein, partial [Planctomycetota bacterium]